MLVSFWPEEATVWQWKSIGLTNTLIHLFWEEAKYEKRTVCTLCFQNENHCWKCLCSALKRDRAWTNKRPLSGIFRPFPLECAASWCVPADLKMLTVHIWVIKESLFTSNNLNPLKHCPESIVLHSLNWHHRRMKGDCNHDYLSVDLCSQMTRMQRLPWLQKKNDLPREINVK